jgi:acylphosphatase
MERQRIVFSGRVQGVGFRATARGVASGFDVTGWVRNEPDGTVLLEVQGPPEQIEQFLAALRERMGRLISRHNTARSSVVEDEAGFEIRR